jgi:predicted permease
MKIPLRAGRNFDEHDTADSQKVIILNETAARRLWPDKEAVGQLVRVLGDDDWKVIGVVGDVHHGSLEQESGLEMYLLIKQSRNGGVGAVDMVVRSRLPIESLSRSVATVMTRIDSNLPTTSFQTLEQVVDRAVSPKRFVTVLLGGFSVLALVLASLGIYGVISYSVSQRTNEIGIRIALGAQTSSVLKLIVGQGAKLAVLGVGIGLIASFVATNLMASLLFGVKATDPLTFLGIAALLTGVALFACYIPARRAAKVDPMIALRYE